MRARPGVHLALFRAAGAEVDQLPAVERGLAPGVEQVEPLLGLAGGARVLAVHVDAIRAAVQLRGAHLDELEQSVLEAGGPIEHQAEQRSSVSGHSGGMRGV